MCAVNPVCPADPLCRAVLPSAAGSYITVLITATRITCCALTDTHSFSHTVPRSVTISSSPLNLSYFHLAQLNALLNAFLLSLFVIRRHFLSLCCLYLCHFGCVPKFPAHPCLHFYLFCSVFHFPLSVAIYLPSPSKSLIRSLSVWAPAQILQMLLHTG